MGNGKKATGDGGEVAVGVSVKSAGSSPKKTLRHSWDDAMTVAKMGTSGETVGNGSDVEETAFGKDLSSLRMPLAPVTMAIGLVNLGILVLRSRRWYRRRLCRRDLLVGLGH